MSVCLLNDDCLPTLRLIEGNSIDSLVTDPPAGISFMGKDWDSNKGGRKEWIAWMSEVMRECHRVLKPGAHGLVWAIPRTSHWTATALEDAGFEIRDVITHLFGSGFPKSQNISIAIDKQSGAIGNRGKGFNVAGQNIQLNANKELRSDHPDYVAPSAITEEAKKWQGWGTALKPASEHWILVRKPISEKTVAANVLKHGTGGINIDASRIAGNVPTTIQGQSSRQGEVYGADQRELHVFEPNPQGRFPANLVFSHSPYCTEEMCDIECAIKMLDEQTIGGRSTKPSSSGKNTKATMFSGGDGSQFAKYSDKGVTSRFFYCAKISTSERGEGNTHPTVKSKKLMGYLIKMITPVNGVVLDPFMGSGSTGLAAKENAFQFIGIEKNKEYFEIAEKRINHTSLKDRPHGKK